MRQTKPGKLPFVTLYHNSVPYNFIIDTGSTLSWTTPEVMGKILLGNETCVKNGITSVTLRVAEGNEDTARKFQAKLRYGEGTEKINEMNVHVKEPIHGILGMDFLSHNVLELHMDTLRLYL